MGTNPRNRRRAGRWAALFVVSLLALGVLSGPRPAQGAEKGRFVEGIVTSVSGTEIEVNGKTYNTRGARLTAGGRKEASPADLSPGKKVQMYFRGENLVSVLVYPRIAE